MSTGSIGMDSYAIIHFIYQPLKYQKQLKKQGVVISLHQFGHISHLLFRCTQPVGIVAAPSPNLYAPIFSAG